MRKKILASTVAGASALALGAGLFAWSATVVTIEGVESAGAVDMVEGCFDGALVISQYDPIYVSSADQWYVTDINVAGGEASDGSGCEGQTLKVSYVNSISDATAQVGSVADLPVDVAFDQDVEVNDAAEGGFGVPLDEVTNWQVVISDEPVV